MSEPRTDPETLLDDTLQIMRHELDAFLRESKLRRLSNFEAESLARYARVLLSAVKDARVSEEEELDGLSNEELLQRLADLTKGAKK